MQAYGQAFARVYNLRWSGFARSVAPMILDFYAATGKDQANKSILDLCCGTGHLALYFLENGYRVTGLDLSEPMLAYARENTRAYIEIGQARFVQGDASHFKLDERFGLVVSTYDALNHLPGMEALRSCFACVRVVCQGDFIFDLNTRRGLRQWNNLTVDENSDEVVIITRGVFDEQGGRAWTRLSGFVREADGRYSRFSETAYNSAYEMAVVKEALLEAGWGRVYCARIQDLQTPLTDPEQESRVFFVASG